ncbi:hypothetical protein ACIA49_01675 [Kribbella sp. NPDC051587]|uniref:hypothetical protein n=1 Tax=Kribbella sp. NPDC051587 TaxID=3364119 RepID=UPI0037B9493B
MRIRTTALALVAGAILGCLAGPAFADPPTSDDCTLTSVGLEQLEPGHFFGEARMQCPVRADIGGRWTLDGVQVRTLADHQGPGEVYVLDDYELSAQPGRELCFIATAWGNDKGKRCLTT